MRNMLQTYRDDAALTSRLSALQEVYDFLNVIEPYSRVVRERLATPQCGEPFCEPVVSPGD